MFENLNARSVYRVITGLAKVGASLRDIQLLLGYESLDTTAVYLDVCPTHLAETVALLEIPETYAYRPRHVQNHNAQEVFRFSPND